MRRHSQTHAASRHVPHPLAAKSRVLGRLSTSPPGGVPPSPPCHTPALTRPLSPEASSFLLLANPEHLSAANARKRAIKTVARNNDTPLLARALSDELWLLDSLLTSPLHRHAKSPTLWSHRRWLVRAYLDDVVGLRACDAAGFLEAELRVVCGAGARHPRNYPAWDYARDVTRVVGLGGFGHTSILRQILHWCLRNPGDTSAWSFLTWLVSRPQVGFDGGGQVVQEVLEAAISLQWTSEAVWGLLRVVLASDLCLSALDREKLMNKLCGLDGAYTTQADAIGPSTQLFLRRVEQSLQWVRQESRRQQESPHRTRYKTSPRRTSTLKDRE